LLTTQHLGGLGCGPGAGAGAGSALAIPLPNSTVAAQAAIIINFFVTRPSFLSCTQILRASPCSRDF
jgi:hypothetical protein